MVEVASSGLFNMILGWLFNPLIWLLIVFLVLGATFGILLIRRKRKLVYPCLEMVSYSPGKMGFNVLKCGWFGKKKYLKGLWDTGDEQLETQDKDIIYEFSTEDFQEINGRRGVVVYRDPVNQNILVPINKASVKNGDLLAEIAPAEYRDVALDIIKEADKETSDFAEKILQFALWAITVIFSLVAVIVIAQMVKHGQTEAAELLKNAGGICSEYAKQTCAELMAHSTAP